MKLNNIVLNNHFPTRVEEKNILPLSNIGHEPQNIAEPPKHLKQAFEQRWRTLVTRSEKRNLFLPDKNLLWKKVMDSWNTGFKCAYCGDKMQIKEAVPSWKTFTLEHKQSLHSGGNNAIENVHIVCRGCNTKKGTLDIATFKDIINGKKVVISGFSMQLGSFCKVHPDGWTSDYRSIDALLRHLGRKSKSEATRKNYLQHIKSFCLWSELTPEDVVRLPKKKAEELVQQFVDMHEDPDYSRRTGNNILAALRSFFEINGFSGDNKLNVEGFYTPTRYRKTDEYIPQKHEIYIMADVARSLRNRAMILVLYSSGIRNSTLRAVRYKDIKDELLRGITILKIPVYPEMKRNVPDACKNSLPYYTFICDEATEALKLYLQDRTDKYGPIDDNDPLFASDYNQINKENRSSKFLTSRQVQKIIKSSAKLAGIINWEWVKPHCLRKSTETVIHSETYDGNRLDPKIQEFLMGRTLPGSQDNYFDRTKIEEIRMEYSKLKFNRIVVEDKFVKLRKTVAKAFEGTGENPDKLIEEYILRKNLLKDALTKKV